MPAPTVYNNPQWRANAAAGGGSAIANQPTGVWFDRISAIAGNSSPTTGSMGLVDHLNAAVHAGPGQRRLAAGVPDGDLQPAGP